MTTTIIALDPGGTTGWASVRLEPRKVPEFNCGQLAADNHHSELNTLLGLNHTDNYTVVCERFEYRAYSRAGLVLDSREYIGVAKLFCQERNVPLVMQSAAQGKGFVKDINIKRLGLWSMGWPHAMDAMRHLLFYIANGGSDDTLVRELGQKLLKEAWK